METKPIISQKCPNIAPRMMLGTVWSVNMAAFAARHDFLRLVLQKSTGTLLYGQIFL